MRYPLKPGTRLVLCVSDQGYAFSLELGKVYRQIPDEAGSRHGLVRVIDESGEDYLYPGEYFVVPARKNKGLSG